MQYLLFVFFLQEFNRQLLEQTAELEQILQEKEKYHKERDMKTEATLQQQIKLINYLQTKVEESNKKKSFAEKLFSHSKKENLPPVISKDLEVQLTRERQKNKVLREEIEVLKKRSEPIEENAVNLEGWIRVVG